jgi:hypothetical protein
LKPGWMRFWLCASVLALAASPGNSGQKPKKGGHGANELSLSAIQPGRDKLAGVEKNLGERLHALPTDSSNARSWVETCTGRRLTLEVDKAGVIQTVYISMPKIAPTDKCKDPKDAQTAQFWTTGQGLHLDEKIERVIGIYGQPNSSGPSVMQGRELELLFYMFDWAGSEVPQVLEISCEKSTGCVVELMLAFPSL